MEQLLLLLKFNVSSELSPRKKSFSPVSVSVHRAAENFVKNAIFPASSCIGTSKLQKFRVVAVSRTLHRMLELQFFVDLGSML